MQEIEPTSLDNVSLTKPSKPKLIYIICLLIVSFVLGGVILFLKFNNIIFKEKPILPKINNSTPSATLSPVAVKTYIPSDKLITHNGNSSFAGEVLEKDETFVMMKGEKKVMNISVRDKIKFIEFPKILTVSLDDYMRNNPTIVDYDSIKKGDALSVNLKFEGEIPIAIGGLIFK